MQTKLYSKIIGTGSFIPKNKVRNEDFINHEFYSRDGQRIETANDVVIEKFKAITTIAERRYVDDDMVASDLAHLAGKRAIEDAKIDPETLDYIIVAHNSGDISNTNRQLDVIPGLSSRVKYLLGIKNPDTIAYDLPFGCPGWVQALIQADYYLKSGDAKRALVIGAEVLSRVCDPHDRDSMIFSDGAGAVVVEAIESESPDGILAHKTRSDTLEHSKLLVMDKSYHITDNTNGISYIKMFGRKVYQYALENVPTAMKATLEKSNIPIEDVKKVLIHQANGKMDEAILKRFYKLYGIRELPENIMPMTVDWLGNSSVATVPTLLDLILKGQMEEHEINPGDIIIFASVGAGMNINAAVYRF